MDNTFRERKLLLLKIQSGRLKLREDLACGTITTEDIIWLSKRDCGYGLEKVTTEKEKLLQEIYNSPFLLCDQDNLDLRIKTLLPYILENRYKTEIEELKYFYSSGFITKEELKAKRDLIKYSYYYTSEDGQYILRRGHVKTL